MFSLFNFSSIFPGGQLTPICPHVGTPMVSMLNKQSVSDNHPTPSPISPKQKSHRIPGFAQFAEIVLGSPGGAVAPFAPYWLRHCRKLQAANNFRRRSTIGGRAFPVAGAKVWNGLPSDVTSASSLSVFKMQAEDILVPPLLRNCLTLNYISFY